MEIERFKIKASKGEMELVKELLDDYLDQTFNILDQGMTFYESVKQNSKK